MTHGRLLTVAIATYGRGPKAERVVRKFIELIEREGLRNTVEIQISDNASPDDTEARLRPLATEQPVRVRYVRQRDNLGFDGNTSFLYEACETPYMWLFGDDDIPFDGSLTRIVGVLEKVSPDMMLFSFQQPPGSTYRQFDFPEAVRVVHDPREQAELVIRYTKISIFVYRCIRLSDEQRRMLAHYLLHPGWYYVGLAYTILTAAASPRLAVVSEPLAGSDAEWAKVAYSPMPYLTLGEAVNHPFVQRHAPQLIRRTRSNGYRIALAWCLQAKCGVLQPECARQYDDFFRNELPFRPLVLLSRPRSAWIYFLMWSGLWRLLPSAARSRR